MDINATTMRSIFTTITAAFNQKFSETETFYKTVAMVVNSTTSANEYPRLDDLPGFREWVGDRVVNSLSGQSYTIQNRTFEKTIGLSRDKIEDDQIGLFKPVVQQLAQDAASFPDSLVFPLFKNGDKKLCYDGQYFFDTDHKGFNEQGNEASVSNFIKGDKPAWYLIDDTQALKPMIYQVRKPFDLDTLDKETDNNVFQKNEFLYGVKGRCNAGFGLWQLAHKATVELTPENYAKARAQMMSIRKRNGEVINIRPTKLLVPASLEGAARRLLKNEQINGSTNEWQGTAEPVVIPLLG